MELSASVCVDMGNVCCVLVNGASCYSHYISGYRVRKLNAFVCIYMGSACSVFVNAVSYYLLTYLDSNFDNVG